MKLSASSWLPTGRPAVAKLSVAVTAYNSLDNLDQEYSAGRPAAVISNCIFVSGHRRAGCDGCDEKNKSSDVNIVFQSLRECNLFPD